MPSSRRSEGNHQLPPHKREYEDYKQILKLSLTPRCKVTLFTPRFATIPSPVIRYLINDFGKIVGYLTLSPQAHALVANLLTLIPTLIKVKRNLPSASFYESHSHRRSRLSVSERTQAFITRYRSVNPATAGCSLQKPTRLFAYRSRGLET